MSIYRQFWLAILVTTVCAFSGSFIVGMLSARHYLEEQLAIKNADNAAALALSISQQATQDPVTQELLVAAQFDTGHYELISLADPFGKIVVQRASQPEAGDVPSWFVRLFPIDSIPGTAQVTSGWKQIGAIKIIGHSHFAHAELWRSAVRQLMFFALGGMLVGLCGMLMVRRLHRPLASVVAQADAISERRFITIPAPGVPELDHLANAMNSMVTRLKSMFEEQSSHLESLRKEANHDPLTGLVNRRYFQNRLQELLESDESASDGTLLLLRVPDLIELNRRFGHDAVDELLRQIGQAIESLARMHEDALAARLNGSDFALLLPGTEDGRPAAESLLAHIREVMLGWPGIDALAQIGLGHYRPGMSSGSVLARVDRALAAAEAEGGNTWQSARDETSGFQPVNATEWTRQIEQAITAGRLRLAEFPVSNLAGKTLHHECLLRLRTSDTGEWLAAGQFMPMAVRLKLTTDLDLAAVRMALTRLANTEGDVAVNLAAESVADESFRLELQRLLQQTPTSARLWLEIPESGLFRHFTAVRALRDELSGLNVRFGIEHMGRRFQSVGQLQELGLHYIKVDAVFIRGVDTNHGNQAFLKGLASITRGMGIKLVAEGVQTDEELVLLPELGFDGATGPAVTAGTR